MNTSLQPETPLRRAIRHEFQAIRGKWGWLVALGLALILLASVLIAFPVVATLATIAILGALILVAGAAETLGAFWFREWSGFFLALLSGILGIVIGLMLLANPIRGGITLTLLLACFLFVGGIFKTAAALTHRVEGWPWLLLSGLIDIVLGVLIWQELPIAGLTVIGLLVGISILFRGFLWLMLGLALRRLPRPSA